MRQRVDDAVRSWWLPAAVGALPVVVATIRAVAGDWLPMGDNAYFTVRARDVLTSHHPLVGAWSSGSVTAGVEVNNLGPLQLDLLALPVKLDWQAGTAIGVALVNVAAIVLAVRAGHRAAGATGAWVTAAGAAAVAWAMGSELLYEPRQHHALMLPFFCLLVLAWAASSGWRWALPWAAGVASLVVQTHLSYAVPTTIVSVAVVVGFVLAERARDEEAPSLRPVLAATAVVAVLCWLQPLVEQVTADDGGNLSAVVEAAGSDVPSAGAGHGLRAVASVIALPPWWSGDGFADFSPEGDLPGTAASAVALLVVVAILGIGWWFARSEDDRPAAAIAVLGVFAIAVAWLAGATQARGEPFGLVEGNYRWLWPISVFVTMALAVLALRLWGHRSAAVPAAVATLVLVVAALVPAQRSEVLVTDEPLRATTAALVRELDALDGLGPVVVERGGVFFGEPYTYALLVGLQDRGIDFQMGDERDLLRFGEGRRPDGTATGTIRLASGDGALAPEPGEERVVFLAGLDDAERDELLDLRATSDRSASEQERLDELESEWLTETVAVMYRPAEPG